MWSKKRVYVGLVCGSLTLAAVAQEPASDPFTPTVTREEAEWIQSARSESAKDPAAAIASLTERELEEHSAALDFTLGNLYFQEEAYEKAAEAYGRALKKFPAFRDAKVNLGRIRLVQGDWKEAIGLYQDLVSDGVADADTYLYLGHALMMDSTPVPAESAYRQALLRDRSLVEAERGLVNALMAQEKHREALSLVKAMLKADPARKELWGVRANAELALETYGAALRTLEQARRLGQTDGDMLATLGDLYVREEMPEEAADAYTVAFEAMDLGPGRMIRAVRSLMRTGSLEHAVELKERLDGMLEELAETERESWRLPALRLESELLMERGKTKAAAKVCRDILETDPMDGEILLRLAEVLEGKDRLEEAVMLCERAARADGFAARALVAQARIEVARQRIGKAVELLERAQVFEERAHVARYLRQLRRMQ